MLSFHSSKLIHAFAPRVGKSNWIKSRFQNLTIGSPCSIWTSRLYCSSNSQTSFSTEDQNIESVESLIKPYFLHQKIKTPLISSDGEHVAYLLKTPSLSSVQYDLVVQNGFDYKTKKVVLDSSKFKIHQYLWSPNNSAIYAIADIEENKSNWQMITVDINTGEVKVLPQDPKARRWGLISLSGSDTDFLFGSNHVTGRYFDMYRYNVVSGKETLEAESTLELNAMAWLASPTELVAHRSIDTITGQNIIRFRETHLTDVGHRDPKGPWKTIAKTSPNIEIHPMSITPENKIVAISQLMNDTSRLVLMEPDSGSVSSVLASDPKYDIVNVLIDPLSGNADGYAIGGFAHKWIPLQQKYNDTFALLERLTSYLHFDQWEIISRSHDQFKFIVKLKSHDKLPEYWMIAGTKAVNIEDKPKDVVDETIGKTHFYEVPSPYDQVPIQCYITLPKVVRGKDQDIAEEMTQEDKKSYPLLVLLSNPHVKEDVEYHSLTQYYVDLGYAVLKLNLHGSPGYGQKFVEAGCGPKGLEVQVQDLKHALDAVIEHFNIDSSRVAIMGTNYGGILTTHILKEYPSLFACAIIKSVPMDLALTIRNMPSHYRPPILTFRRIFGPVDSNLIVNQSTSPRYLASAIKTPIFVVSQFGPSENLNLVQDFIREMREAGNENIQAIHYESQTEINVNDDHIDFLKHSDMFLSKYLGGVTPKKKILPTQHNTTRKELL